MPARPSASLFGTLASLRAAALIAPAILFLGAPLVIAQSTPPADAPAASKAPEATGPSAFTPAQRKELESLIKDIREAQIYAKRAQQIFARGTRGWLIAEDIVTYKIPT